MALNVEKIVRTQFSKSKMQGYTLGLFRWVLFSGLMFVIVYPLLFTFSTAVKSYDDMVNPMIAWVAHKPNIMNFADAFTRIRYMEGFVNTIAVVIPTAIFQMFSCAFAGYGFARFKFKERNLIFALLIFMLTVPSQAINISRFMLFKEAGMMDSFLPIILPSLVGLGIKTPLYIYIFRQFFRALPKELEEAAHIDGCGFMRCYFNIMLPNIYSALLTVFLFSFVWNWNDVFEVSLYVLSPKLNTLAMRLVNINGYINPGNATGVVQMRDSIKLLPVKFAGIALVIIPLIVLFAFAQKYFVRGFERAGLGGE